MFESNVRDHQGENSVNTEIMETFVDGTGENFWWLNKGMEYYKKLKTSVIQLFIFSMPAVLWLHLEDVVDR